MRSGRVPIYDDFDTLRLDKSDRGMMAPAAAKDTVSSCPQSGLGGLPVLDSVFSKNPPPPGLECSKPLVLRFFPVVDPFLAGRDESTRCTTRLRHAWEREVELEFLTKIALGAD